MPGKTARAAKKPPTAPRSKAAAAIAMHVAILTVRLFGRRPLSGSEALRDSPAMEAGIVAVFSKSEQTRKPHPSQKTESSAISLWHCGQIKSAPSLHARSARWETHERPSLTRLANSIAAAYQHCVSRIFHLIHSFLSVVNLSVKNKAIDVKTDIFAPGSAWPSSRRTKPPDIRAKLIALIDFANAGSRQANPPGHWKRQYNWKIARLNEPWRKNT